MKLVKGQTKIWPCYRVRVLHNLYWQRKSRAEIRMERKHGGVTKWSWIVLRCVCYLQRNIQKYLGHKL